MELIKKNIHRNRQKGKTVTQVTLDDDFIVPDTKEDVEALILDSNEVEVEESRLMGNRCAVKGRLQFHLLYHTQKNRSVDNMEGALPFEEFINGRGGIPGECGVGQPVHRNGADRRTDP